ncbi:caspase domain-containing protein [Streptomyces sp. NPDC014870]|uniref:caspase family protein n=1 Tax=Streptomyces sp. NPDC014870 TaxID=3364925 RepID=UPI0037030B2F
MPAGISVHVGLNKVDPARYEGWDGALNACENDARDMAALARAAGFSDTVLLTPDGTVDQVTGALREAAGSLGPGDILLFTYSGHGGQVPDTTGDDDESDSLDETLVLYDRQFLDDEVNREFRAFADGVRIVALLDCCHSGTAIEMPGAAPPETAVRLMPPFRQQEIYARDQGFFDELQRSLAKDSPNGETSQATALLISGCQDNQFSLDGDANGAFTAALLEVWDSGGFRGGYRSFHRAIQSRLPATQSPNFYTTGAPPPTFLRQRPFTV